ncbi:YceI family protein [Heyndrickxia coagulans]|uniref:YceI family protein n=1 Tax=Heyndrickxia TaxID=2837504 RepID=UPI00105C596D|nr:YceI family protein [Heyndrickxia coagulans]MBF8419055.1 polyisoprenoid-binding protein [Heyndrickxia coagulans]MEC5269574.1 YceI family protein [Heyndrickxia coagulans]MED4405718.1 YceI family protein [Heyndrickxia coagulans]MED4935201.1 YceI family protein [Heyndrickxia coagulans]MED4966505.1 YceI family protein [Heyndrickxia coagulans]
MAKTKWAVDYAHSTIDFTVKHMMISKVKGSFQNFEVELEADPQDLTDANISFIIDASSISTKNDDRDNHLRSADFLDVEQYPKITFVSKSVTKAGNNEYNVTGDLTIRGVTKEETFKVTFEGISKNPMSGAETAGFSAEGTVKRSNYGLTWNAALETGGVLVGDEIKFTVELEASKAE